MYDKYNERLQPTTKNLSTLANGIAAIPIPNPSSVYLLEENIISHPVTYANWNQQQDVYFKPLFIEASLQTRRFPKLDLIY